jgi:ABC-type Fe3+-siderophore transport system permease subunit
MTTAGLLAHAGGIGWDEALFMALPVVILLLLARQARKKIDEAEDDDS